MNRRTLIAGVLAGPIAAMVPMANRVLAAPAPKGEAGLRTLTFDDYGWTYNRGDEAFIYPDAWVGDLSVGERIVIEGFDAPMEVVAANPEGHGGWFIRQASLVAL